MSIFPTKPAFAQTREDRERALAWLQESMEAYEGGAHERALGLLRRAYAVYPAPDILYNIGRTLEVLGRPAEAADAYERYLEEAPAVEDEPRIRARIASLRAPPEVETPREERLPELEASPPSERAAVLSPEAHAPGAALAAEEASPVETSSAETSSAETSPDVTSSDAEPPGSARVGGPLGLMTGGAALAAFGLPPGVLSRLRHREAEEGETSHLEATQLQDDAKRLARVANTLFAVGAAAGLAGLAWLLARLIRGPLADDPVALGWTPAGVRLRF